MKMVFPLLVLAATTFGYQDYTYWSGGVNHPSTWRIWNGTYFDMNDFEATDVVQLEAFHVSFRHHDPLGTFQWCVVLCDTNPLYSSSAPSLLASGQGTRDTGGYDGIVTFSPDLIIEQPTFCVFLYAIAPGGLDYPCIDEDGVYPGDHSIMSDWPPYESTDFFPQWEGDFNMSITALAEAGLEPETWGSVKACL